MPKVPGIDEPYQSTSEQPWGEMDLYGQKQLDLMTRDDIMSKAAEEYWGTYKYLQQLKKKNPKEYKNLDPDQYIRQHHPLLHMANAVQKSLRGRAAGKKPEEFIPDYALTSFPTPTKDAYEHLEDRDLLSGGPAGAAAYVTPKKPGRIRLMEGSFDSPDITPGESWTHEGGHLRHWEKKRLQGGKDPVGRKVGRALQKEGTYKPIPPFIGANVKDPHRQWMAPYAGTSPEEAFATLQQLRAVQPAERPMDAGQLAPLFQSMAAGAGGDVSPEELMQVLLAR